jgi:hypothetical protein
MRKKFLIRIITSDKSCAQFIATKTKVMQNQKLCQALEQLILRYF